ncbi:zinc finger, CCHC-type containing protein [Tanacetum coccineum]
MAAAMKHMVANFSKLGKFEGVDFRRWQKKMHFLFSTMSVVKELWDSLDAKYMVEDASRKKFLVSDFINYKMTDLRPVMEQYNELLGILDFKHTLKHKKDELTLVEFGFHLRIEESLGLLDGDKPKGNNVFGPSVVNLDDDVAWWVDSGATVHVCKDRCWFKIYESLNDGSILHMGNESTALVLLCLLFHTKDEALDKLKVFKIEVELQQGSLIKRSRTDIGGEYMDTLYFQYVGIIHETTAPYTTQQNGISERKNRVMKEMVNSMLSYSGPSQDEPKTFDKAMKSQNVAFWKEEIYDAMDSIMGNNTWMFADLLPGCKPMGCKKIFKKKMKVDGTVEKFKAKLVIQGFRQKSRIDYFDTYALVAHISTIRLMIALALKTSQADKCVDMTKKFLSSRFSMKDMRDANVILSIRIKHESNGISISQSHYIEKILKKFNYFDYTPVSTSMDTSDKLMPNNGQTASKKQTCITSSTMKYEFVALAAVATLANAYSQMYNGKSIHLGVRHSMIRELIRNGVVSIEFVRSQQNLANHLTKGLARDLVIRSVERMGLKSNLIAEY